MSNVIKQACGFELHATSTPRAFVVKIPPNYPRSTFALVVDEFGEIIDGSNAQQLRGVAKHGYAWAQIQLRDYFRVSERQTDERTSTN